MNREEIKLKDVVVTVVMSAYHEEPKHLRMAVESILKQTYTKFEFIIILDDPNNYLLKEMLEQYAKFDKRIRFIVNDQNRGLTFCRNKAISYANGDLIAIMDADDIAKPNRLEIEAQYFFEHKECGIVFGNAIIIDERNKVIRKCNYNVKDKQISKIIPLTNLIMNPTSMVRKSVYAQIGGYREIRYAEDYDFWLRCCSNNICFHHINEYVLMYRERQDSISHHNAARSFFITDYVKKLYKERKKNRNDSFSEAELKKILSLESDSNYKAKKFNEKVSQYYKAIAKIKMGQLDYILTLMACILTEPKLMKKMSQMLVVHILMRIQEEHNNTSNKKRGYENDRTSI